MPNISDAERDLYRKYREPVSGPIPGTNSTFMASDGAKVPLAIWKPSGKLRGIVLASPGMDMGCGEFAPLGAYLARSGFGVWALDLRGQGHEQDIRARGKRAPWHRWVRDVEELATALRRAHQDTPIYLTAQSTGNCVSILAAANLPPGIVQGLILHSVPFVYLYPSSTSLIGNSFLRGPLRSVSFTSAFGLSHSAYSFSSDHVALEEWLSSPLRVRMQGAFLGDCFDLGAAARSSLAKIDLPVLVQLGCQDSLAGKAANPATAAERLVTEMSRAKVTVQCYDSLGHLVLREAGSKAVFESDVRWLRKQGREGE